MPTENQKTRRLSAIMFTDIVGYSAMMQRNEDAAAKVREQHRQEFQKYHDQFNGEVLQYFGDGTLSVFQSGVQAVECAMAIQKALNKGKEVPLRIGLHMGDVVFDGTEIYGDGVNVASRIESIGAAGTVLLSAKLNDELKNHMDISTASLGYFEFKNIETPVEVFSVTNDGIKIPDPTELRAKRKSDNKSIAVLPFVNMSSNEETEYFSDGMTEEIINALAKIKNLKVTSRTSSFFFKNKQVPIPKIGKELNVATILEGSIRLSGNKMRITAQLINVGDDFHFWSETWDRKLEDVFELQDEVSLLIADKIRENFGHMEIKEHLIDNQTSNVEAYQQFLKGRFYQLNWKLEDFYRAIDFYKLSIKLDPNYYKPYFGLVQCYGILGSWDFMNKDEAFKEVGIYMAKGMALNANSPETYFALATQSLWVNWNIEDALGHLTKALEISPHDTEVLESCAECYTAVGKFGEALKSINKALVYSPLSANHHYTKGNIYYLQGEYSIAIGWMDKALAIDPKWDLAWQVKASCSILMNNKEELNSIFDKYPDISNKSDFLLLFEIYNEGRKAIETDFLKDHTGYLPWEVYISLCMGDIDKAIATLKYGIDNRIGQYINFINDPLLLPLKGNEVFENLSLSTFSINDGLSFSTKKETRERPKLTPEEIDVFKKDLTQVMDTQQPYLDSTLTLRSLADLIDLHPNKLSWLLNEAIGKNFSDFVNGYRIEVFQSKAVDPSKNHLTLLGLAYESGFNSKSVFNDSFKKTTGSTPKAWVNKNKP